MGLASLGPAQESSCLEILEGTRGWRQETQQSPWFVWRSGGSAGTPRPHLSPDGSPHWGNSGNRIQRRFPMIQMFSLKKCRLIFFTVFPFIPSFRDWTNFPEQPWFWLAQSFYICGSQAFFIGSQPSSCLPACCCRLIQVITVNSRMVLCTSNWWWQLALGIC